MKPRVVLPGTFTRGLAVYWASVEKPSFESVTSGWLEPPQPRNSAAPDAPECLRGLVEAEVEGVADWGRLSAGPSSTSRARRWCPRARRRGAARSCLVSSVPNSPVITLSGVIARPPQGVVRPGPVSAGIVCGGDCAAAPGARASTTRAETAAEALRSTDASLWRARFRDNQAGTVPAALAHAVPRDLGSTTAAGPRRGTGGGLAWQKQGSSSDGARTSPAARRRDSRSSTRPFSTGEGSGGRQDRVVRGGAAHSPRRRPRRLLAAAREPGSDERAPGG